MYNRKTEKKGILHVDKLEGKHTHFCKDCGKNVNTRIHRKDLSKVNLLERHKENAWGETPERARETRKFIREQRKMRRVFGR